MGDTGLVKRVLVGVEKKAFGGGVDGIVPGEK
jgi:hypothetical protein